MQGCVRLRKGIHLSCDADVVWHCHIHASVLCYQVCRCGSVALWLVRVSVLYISCNHHQYVQKHGIVCLQLWRRSWLIGLFHFGNSVFVHSRLLRTGVDARPAVFLFSLINRHYNFCQSCC